MFDSFDPRWATTPAIETARIGVIGISIRIRETEAATRAMSS
jgi:hypothetical protein